MVLICAALVCSVVGTHLIIIINYRAFAVSFKALQVLLVSCESANKDTGNVQQQKPQNKNEESGPRISTIPLRSSDKTARFIIRRSRPHLVTYNIVKTPLHTLGESTLLLDIPYSHTCN